MQRFDICGVLIPARTSQTEPVSTRLRALPGVEVHAATDDGRLVVTVEDAGEYRCVDTAAAIQDVEGVISASLVYQHTDTTDTSQESAQ